MDTTTIVMIIVGGIGALCLWWLVDWKDKYFDNGVFKDPDEKD